jgi:aminopeptidase N
MRNIILIAFLSHLVCFQSFGQYNDNRSLEYDILKYAPYIKLDPDTSFILVKSQIEIEFLMDLETLYLDLHCVDKKTGKGMKVDYVIDSKYQDTLIFEHEDDQLFIRSVRFQKGYSTDLLIFYSGSPKDGLIFSKNKFGNRTVFADNWPNRAHHWLVCNDHPSDKAIWEVMVEAPKGYQVISNGNPYKENGSYDENNNRFIFTTKVEIPTKVMVIAVAKFAVDKLEDLNGIPVSSWVFPENESEGFHDYAQARDVLKWFIDKIDEYPFQKLANVQSKTIFGGMENAGCIFYHENSVTGKRNHEDLLAHEIAHQWFGNSASEIHWSHLWLSEGFATYLTDLYILDKYGEEEFQKRLKKERNQVKRFANNNDSPVVDDTDDYMSLLNANSYKKGAWTLHMLRDKVGNDLFWEIIKEYYKKYKLSNASTNDFFQVAELYSKMDLAKFKEDWLLQPQIPNIRIDIAIKGKKAELIVKQTQKHLIDFPIYILAKGSNNSKKMKFDIKDEESILNIMTDFKIKEIIIDPDTKLLFQEK